MHHFDIAIIGDRIAAAAALIGLTQQPDIASRSIVIIAPKQQRGDQPLVGESLPPTIKPLLQQMQLWDDFCALNYPESQIRYSCWQNEQLQPINAGPTAHGFGWCIDRRQFVPVQLHVYIVDFKLLCETPNSKKIIAKFRCSRI